MRRGASGPYRTAESWPRSTALYFSTFQPPEVARGAWIPSGGAAGLRLENREWGVGSGEWEYESKMSLIDSPLPTPYSLLPISFGGHYENSVCHYCGAVAGRHFRVRAGRAGPPSRRRQPCFQRARTGLG